MRTNARKRKEVAESLRKKPTGTMIHGAIEDAPQGICPTCGKEVRDQKSMDEWTTSGMCQECQDAPLGKEEPNRHGTPVKKDRWSELTGILIVSTANFEEYCARLFNKVIRHYQKTGTRPDIVMTVPRGGDIPAGRVYMMLKSEWPDLEYTYWNKDELKAGVNVKGKNVLVIDDICRTGHVAEQVRTGCEGANVVFAVLIHYTTAKTHPDLAVVDVKEENIGVYFPWKSWPVAMGHIYPRREVE